MKKLLTLSAIFFASIGLLSSAASEQATEKATLFQSLAEQIISEDKNPEEKKEQLVQLFSGCAANWPDFTLREACEIVYKKLSWEERTQESLNIPIPSNKEYGLIEVVDGDTIKIKDENGNIISVRMIGIDAPESNTTRYGYAECFGKEAKGHLEELLRGEDKVQLEFDTTQGNYDKYNRLLAYVISRGQNINKKMIDDGFAFEYTYNLPYNHQAEFKSAQKDASLSGRGLRAGSACQGQRVKDTRNEPTDVSSASSSSSSYEPSDNSDNSSSPYSYIAPLKSTYGSDGKTYITGPRGGCYYINSNGNKTYVDHSLCGTSYSESSYTWHTGPRGGQYYYNSKGKKVYKKRK